MTDSTTHSDGSPDSTPRALLFGATGRLGREILGAAQSPDAGDIEVTALERSFEGKLEASLVSPCVIIDVSMPEGTRALATALAALPPATLAQCRSYLCGVTGHSEKSKAALDHLSALLPVALVSNFSRGIALLGEILGARTADGRTVAQRARDFGFDIALWESHHTKKMDAPSGTARTLAQIADIAEDRIASSRVGAVVGEHVVLLSADGEELRLSHVAHSRRLFALGALDMARRAFDLKRNAGLYDGWALVSKRGPTPEN